MTTTAKQNTQTLRLYRRFAELPATKQEELQTKYLCPICLTIIPTSETDIVINCPVCHRKYSLAYLEKYRSSVEQYSQLIGKKITTKHYSIKVKDLLLPMTQGLLKFKYLLEFDPEIHCRSYQAKTEQWTEPAEQFYQSYK